MIFILYNYKINYGLKGFILIIRIIRIKIDHKNRFSFDRRKVIFFALNSCLFGLTVLVYFWQLLLKATHKYLE